MTAAAAGATLALESLTRRFGETVAVDALSLEVARGELLALVGASGSGKTTTLRLIAGYETPDSGRVLLSSGDGADAARAPRDITRLPPERRGFGMVFQHYALFPHLSAGENVAFGLEARGVARSERRRRAAAALESVGLAGAAPRAVQSLSGGEQQRVALARALVIEPRVLLLDEPLSNLDPLLRRSTRAELRAMLHRLHVTAVLVTHDQEDAFAVADRIALLARGRLLQVGRPEELYDRPASRAVAEFIGEATLVPALYDGSTARIEIAGRAQTVPAVAPPDLPSGAALAVLRPGALEAIGLADAQPDGSTWPGVVADRRFAGGLTAYRVQLDGGVTLELHAPTRDVDGSHSVGSRDALAAATPDAGHGPPERARVAVRVARAPVAVVAP